MSLPEKESEYHQRSEVCRTDAAQKRASPDKEREADEPSSVEVLKATPRDERTGQISEVKHLERESG